MLLERLDAVAVVYRLASTAGVHWFLARLAVQARAEGGWSVVQLDPPHRATRYFRYGGALRSVHPDAFGVLQRGADAWPFFLEWERRALHPSTMAARLAPYLRYYATDRPVADHGTQPALLVVFDDAVAPAHFLRIVRNEPAVGWSCRCGRRRVATWGLPGRSGRDGVAHRLPQSGALSVERHPSCRGCGGEGSGLGALPGVTRSVSCFLAACAVVIA